MRPLPFVAVVFVALTPCALAEDVCQQGVCVRDYSEAGCLGAGAYTENRAETFGAGLCRWPFGTTSSDAIVCLGENPCTPVSVLS